MAGFFSAATLEQVRAANDIVEVVGSYIPLKRAGASFAALCPFHKERTPSFHVNPQRQTFHCYGCHKGGDVFSFVKEYENLDFPDAVRRLAERARIPLETDSRPGEGQSRQLKDLLLDIHEQITQRWQIALATDAAGQVARDYLARRGVTPEAVQIFRLGYAPDLWDDTVNWAGAKHYDLETMEKTGLILRKEGSDHFYDRFRGRLMFPICDEQGRVIGFSGRILDSDAKSAKYVNSPETPIFTKSKVFFGLHKSKRALLDTGFAVICEGQLDLITCYMAGVENIVAPQGTAFTGDHARILKRYVNEVVLCFDSDDAGQNASVRSLDHLLAAGLTAKVAVIPAPHDPDSFIKSAGPAAFKELLGKAEGFFEYYLNRLCLMNDVATDAGRLRVLTGMSDAVNKTGNAVLVDTYAQKTALRLGVDPAAVRAEFKKTGKSGPVRAEPAEEPAPAAPVARPAPHELWLLKLLLMHDELLDTAAAQLDPRWISHPGVRQIVARRLALHQGHEWLGVPAFLNELGDATLQSLTTEAVAENRTVPEPARQLADLILRLRNVSIDAEVAALVRRAAEPGVSEVEQLDLLRRQLELRQLKRQPLSTPA